MARGGGCRDERRGSSASEVGTVDGTAKKRKKKKKKKKEETRDITNCAVTHVRLTWITSPVSSLHETGTPCLGLH